MVDDQYTKSLLNFDGSNHDTTFTDGYGRTWTNGSGGNACWLSTTQAEFGASSLTPQTPHTAGFLTTPITSDLQFGSGDFTVDFWLYSDGSMYIVAPLYDFYQDGLNYLEFGINKIFSNYFLHFNIIVAGSYVQNLNSSPFSLPTTGFHHLSVIRNGATTYLALDGAQIGSGASVNVPAFTGTLRLAPATYMDEVRTSVGIARWTSFPFTPPTSAYDQTYPAPIFAVPLAATLALTASVSNPTGDPMITAVPLAETLALTASSARGQNAGIANLPVLLGSSVGAVRSGVQSAKLPVLSGTAHGFTGLGATASAKLPFVQASATGLTGAIGEGAATLPLLTVSATGSPAKSSVGAATLPFFYTVAHGSMASTTPRFKIVVMNLRNFAVSRYENFDFNSFAQINGVYMGAKADGIYPLVGSSDQGTEIDAKITTGKAFVENYRLRDLFSYGLSGGQKRSKLARGIHSGYTDFTLENSDGDEFDLDYFEVLGDPLRRKRH